MNTLLWGDGRVFHKRYGAVSNQFSYPILYMHFAAKHEEDLRELFMKRYRRVFSIRSEDYLDGRVGPLEKSARDFVLEKCNYAAENISLQTFPRMFGYVFNPVSFWFFKRAGLLDAVLCEVRNTFGEKHFYWIDFATTPDSDGWYTADKVFHVSPFLPIEGSYRFRFKVQDDSSRVDINYYTGSQELRLITWIEGKLSPIALGSLTSKLFRYGWMTIFVIARIHTQAARLWFKKAKFYKKPPLPIDEVSR